ncbi:hypothetical protein HDV57DRAFT_285188 [Trichoderma longibrachiatum]|uniref:Uncharacterized protein n=1 Tax=Trichoderma longibrachiatum ATCC 18648 TaxID=983965 RepID=A0A2T4CDJ2_TRILO|nr:hypothetical protein M440DRAFT_241906 [Trichoderma longibrachiatum ATCC 18648]
MQRWHGPSATALLTPFLPSHPRSTHPVAGFRTARRNASDVAVTGPHFTHIALLHAPRGPRSLLEKRRRLGDSTNRAAHRHRHLPSSSTHASGRTNSSWKPPPVDADATRRTKLLLRAKHPDRASQFRKSWSARTTLLGGARRPRSLKKEPSTGEPSLVKRRPVAPRSALKPFPPEATRTTKDSSAIGVMDRSLTLHHVPFRAGILFACQGSPRQTRQRHAGEPSYFFSAEAPRGD